MKTKFEVHIYGETDGVLPVPELRSEVERSIGALRSLRTTITSARMSSNHREDLVVKEEQKKKYEGDDDDDDEDEGKGA